MCKRYKKREKIEKTIKKNAPEEEKTSEKKKRIKQNKQKNGTYGL